MVDVPEPEKEMKPIFRDERKQPGLPCPDKVSVPDLPPSIKSKAQLPAKQSITWDAVRHFLYGMISMGSGAWGAVAIILAKLGTPAVAAVGMSIAPPFGYIIAGLALIGGVVEAGRKVSKVESGGKDWTDIIYAILEFIVKAIQSKGVKK
jgi:hypothetical protein